MVLTALFNGFRRKGYMCLKVNKAKEKVIAVTTEELRQRALPKSMGSGLSRRIEQRPVPW